MGRAPPHPHDGAAPAELEDDDLGPDRQVHVVVVSVGHREVDAAVRPVGQAAAVEGDAAGGEEGGPWHRLVVDVADEIGPAFQETWKVPRGVECADPGLPGSI